MVGGISRTAEREGWRFDIGGHRFFTKVPEVEALWHEILPDEDFLMRPRMSRIFYRGKFYDYPLKAVATRWAISGSSRPPAACFPTAGPGSGRRRTPTRSRAGSSPASAAGSTTTSSRPTTRSSGACPVDELPADFAAQRIKNLSLFNAIMNALKPKTQPERDHLAHRGVPVPQVRPRNDVGDRCREGRRQRGGKIVLEEKVRTVHWEEGKGVTGVTTVVTGGYGPGAGAPEATRTDVGTEHIYPADHVISSMPFSSLIKALDPKPPAEVLAAADALKFRDFLTVAVVVPEKRRLPRQLDLHPLPRGRRRPHPEFRLLVAVPGQGRPHLPGPGVLRQRRRRDLEPVGRRSHRAGQA